MSFLKHRFIIFKKIESEICHIFSWEYATCYWRKKEHKKAKNARSLFLKLKCIL